MIDVVFLLLIFFIATASFEIVEQLMPTGVSDQGIATGVAEQPPPPESLTDVNDCIARILHNKQDGGNSFRYLFNGSEVASREILVQRLTAVVKVKSDIPIIVHPDDDVPIGVAIDIYDQARAAGGLRVYFAAR
jgi:biopolymer transport protein ExbD